MISGPKSPSHLLAADYSSTATGYARLWGPVILPMALPLLERLPVGEAGRLLDLGTGVGGFLEQLRTRAPGAFVCGVDRAEGMVRVAMASRLAPCAVMDAQRLAFRSGAFDLAVMAFVLFHLPRPLDGLLEAARVLRREGRIGLTTWADDPGLPAQDVWTEELDRSGAPPDPRDPSVRQHDLVDRPHKVRALLERAGFGHVEAWTRPYDRSWEVEPLLVLQQGCGAAGRRLAALAPAERSACADRVRARVSTWPPERLVWRAEVLFAIATR